MADNRIDYDYIAQTLKTETDDGFAAMQSYLDKAATEVDSMGWEGSSAAFYKDTIAEVKATILAAQTEFNNKLDSDYSTMVNEYQSAEADSESQTKTIEL